MSKSTTFTFQYLGSSTTTKSKKELSLHRTLGPFKTMPSVSLEVSPMDLDPKRNGDLWLIYHL